MGKQGEEGISWTNFTFNPWWGCAKVSPGCQNCYAETLANRFGVVWGLNAIRKPASENVWAQPIKWNKAAQKAGKRAKVFCASMADVFDDNTPEGSRPRLFELIKNTPWLDWQILTKRPENILKYLPEDWGDGYKNVWLGTTVENQYMADIRIPIILDVPAVTRFISMEPLIGGVNLSSIPANCKPLEGKIGQWDYFNCLSGFPDDDNCSHGEELEQEFPKINWVIVGGESGHNARPMKESWAIDILDQCVQSGTAFLPQRTL
jgi:protein gp37